MCRSDGLPTNNQKLQASAMQGAAGKPCQTDDLSTVALASRCARSAKGVEQVGRQQTCNSHKYHSLQEGPICPQYMPLKSQEATVENEDNTMSNTLVNQIRSCSFIPQWVVEVESCP